MADLVYTRLETLSSTPFLIKRFVGVQEASAGGTLPHGEGRAPDIYFSQLTMANPTAAEVSISSVDATNLTLDCEANSASATCDVVAIWLSQSSGSISA